jgi:riboflavin kinase/FMN adenylyltransferase
MELIRGWHNLRPRHRGCVATLGNFDGVHRGHQAVLQQLAAKARELKLPATVIIFEPQPREYFQGAAGVPARLTRFREKMLAFRQQPVDRVLCLRFDDKLASLSAEAFIDEILVNSLGIRYVVVGDDFRFGAKRTGDIHLLRQCGRQHGFEAAPMHTVMASGERISSTRVRAALEKDNLVEAERLLGRPYCMCGRVAHGDKIGRTLGVPTANVHLHRLATPLHGIYVVSVTGEGLGRVQGVASIGHRPAVNGERTLLEVHLFDFQREIYGHTLQVNFLHKLRNERNFDSLDALKHAMQTDMQQARAWFAQNTPSVTGHAAGPH